jgi:5-keto 4-deoxyuronate isomerase
MMLAVKSHVHKQRPKKLAVKKVAKKMLLAVINVGAAGALATDGDSAHFV